MYQKGKGREREREKKNRGLYKQPQNQLVKAVATGAGMLLANP